MKQESQKLAKLEEMAYQIRRLSIEMITYARLGHIGGAFSMTELSTTVFFLSYPDPLAAFGVPVFTSGNGRRKAQFDRSYLDHSNENATSRSCISSSPIGTWRPSTVESISDLALIPAARRVCQRR